MATTNHERVNKAMELLRSGLAPFVRREVMAKAKVGVVRMETIHRFADDPKLADKPIDDWDAAALLKLMWDTWNDVFRDTLGFTAGDALRELLQTYGPCLILIDEWVSYARQLHDGSDLPGGSFETQTTFAQTLGDFDADTRWALAWFEQHGFEDGEYGDAETLSKAKNTTVLSLETIGVLQSKGGKVRLLIPLALSPEWDPRAAGLVSAWLTVHHLIRVHDAGGEQAAAALVRKLGSVAETARELAYRLYAIAERTKRAREALWYNALVQSWPEIARLAREERAEQATLLAPADAPD